MWNSEFTATTHATMESNKGKCKALCSEPIVSTKVEHRVTQLLLSLYPSRNVFHRARGCLAQKAMPYLFFLRS